MIAWSPRAAAWLLQAAAVQDTQIVKQVAEPRNWFDTVSGVASILISLALLALCVGLIPAAWNFRKSYKKVNDLLDKIYGDVNPIMRHASTIADNVNYVTTAVRVDVQQVNQTIATANERLQDAVRVMERRLTDFNALLAVVQREAEGAFVATAATVRGVRTGAATFHDEAVTPALAGEPRDDDAYAPYDEYDEYDDQPEPGGVTDGIVTDPSGAGERPRIRPRGRGRA